MFLTAKRLRLFLGALLVLQLASCLSTLPFVHQGYIDFRTFYTAGQMVRSGQAAYLYDYQVEQRLQSALMTPNAHALPFMSPPFTALIFAPLSWPGFRVSYLIFFALNLVFGGLAVRIMRPHLAALSSRWKPAPALLFLSFLPVGIALMFGQLSILLLLFCCASFSALQHQKPFLAGLILSLALAKFQIVLPVALLFLIWRRWRFVAGFVTGAVLLLAISLYLTGGVLLNYLHSLAGMSQGISTAAAQSRVGIFPIQMPNLFGLLHSLSGGAPWGQGLGLAFSALVLVWAMSQRPSLPLALLAGLLVSYHLYLYDLTILLLLRSAYSRMNSYPSLPTQCRPRSILRARRASASGEPPAPSTPALLS